LKNKKYSGVVSLKGQELPFFRPQKINSKGMTTGTVIVTGSAKPISCIRIRQANFPGTRDRQWVSVGYTDCGDILLQGSLNLRLQKVISKETTTGTVIVTGSAKPIFCIRIRQANFPGTRDRQWVSVGYTDCGDILLQINYARHVPALKIP